MCSPVKDTWTFFQFPLSLSLLSHLPHVGVSTLPCSHPAPRHSSLRCIVTIYTVFVVHFMSLFAFSWYHMDAENTGNMRTNFPCGLLSVAIGAWTNPCVSNTTIRGERHYPVENNNPGIGCSVHCTFSSVEEDVETDTQLSAMQYILPAANMFRIKEK